MKSAALFSVLGLVVSTFALQCYVCNTGKDCGDGDTGYGYPTSHITTCPADATGCLKIRATTDKDGPSDDAESFSRRCTSFEISNEDCIKPAYTTWLPGVPYLYIYSCYCTADLCNEASSPALSFSIIMACASVLALWMIVW